MGTIKGFSSVAEVMSQGLWTIAPDRSLRQAAALMAEEGLEMLTVEDEDGHVAGILAWETIADATARGMLDFPVALVMEPLPRVCYPADSIDRAQAMMAGLGTFQLPVCDIEGRPLGTISADDSMDPSIFPSRIPTSFHPLGSGPNKGSARTIH